MGRIAHDRVSNVLHVSPQLVTAPGQWLKLDLSPAKPGKPALRNRKLPAADRPEQRSGLLKFDASRTVVLFEPAQRVIDPKLIGRPAPDDRAVMLEQPRSLIELHAQQARSVSIEGEGQHSAGPLVESMQRPHQAPDLGPNRAQHDTALMTIQGRRMDQPARGLVDDQKVVVLVEGLYHCSDAF